MSRAASNSDANANRNSAPINASGPYRNSGQNASTSPICHTMKTPATIGERAVNAIITRYNLSKALEMSGDVEAGLIELETAIEYAREALPPGHWYVGVFLDAKGDFLSTLDRHEDALTAHEEELAIFQAALGPVHARTRRAVASVADALAALDRADDVESLWRQRLADLRALEQMDQPSLDNALLGLSDTLMARQAYEETMTHLREAREARATAGDDARRLVSVESRLALCRARLGEESVARETLTLVERALEEITAEEQDGDALEWARETAQRVADAYAALGDAAIATRWTNWIGALAAETP